MNSAVLFIHSLKVFLGRYLPRQSTCFQNNVISCSNRSDNAFDERPQIGSPDAEGTAGYLGAIIERIGEAKFQRIVLKIG